MADEVVNLIDEDDDEFYDSEIEPSILEEYIYDESLNESIVSEVANTYYAVQFKKDSINDGNSEDRIFMHQENAIKLLKKDPTNRRFKSFKSFQEAYSFSYEHESSEYVPSLSQVKASIDPFKDRTNLKENAPRASNLDAEKLPYSAPKKPEVNQMRQFIEKNDIASFRAKVLSNPRFLISAGDSPNLCQESFRYNCLHVCAKENRFEICDILLKILNSTSYIQKLYKNDTAEQSQMRCDHLLDLYLNMPEKGLNETPLHFACKFGSLEVAKMLMSFEICQRTVPNKHGKTPQDLICVKASTQKARDNEQAIKNLFEECFYVSLYRDDERGDVIVDKPAPQLSLLKPQTSNANDLMFNKKFSPSINYESNRKLAAYVGPVSPKNANAIYDRLKSPARLRQSPNNLDILRSDDFKGYERIIRQFTDEMKLPWTEFWAFLNGFSNLKSKEGLEKLEIYLEQKKMQSILDSQKKTTLSIRNEQNVNLFNPAKRNIDLIAKLEEFIQIIDELKTTLDLKENILSSKYEKLIQSIKENTTSSLIIDADDLNEINEERLKIVLKRYMSTIIVILKLTKESTRSYFDIYKTAKTVFELLHYEDIYSNFTFSPVNNHRMSTAFKQPMQIDSKTMNFTMKKPMKRLTPKKKEIYNPYQMRKPTFEYNSDEDEEEQDDNKESESDSCDSSDDENEAEVMESNLADAEADNLDFLISKLNNGMKIEEKVKKLDEEGYSLNNVENLKPVFSGFKKPADIKGMCNLNNVNKQCKLFMYGEAPSKLDRAVYLAIMDINEEIESFALLGEWYNYMKSCNKTEMSGWKTPMRNKIQF